MTENFADRVASAPFGTRLLVVGVAVLVVILVTSCGFSLSAGLGILGWTESNGLMLSMILIFVVMSLFGAALSQRR